MNGTISPTAPRPTLKLKADARKRTALTRTPSAPISDHRSKLTPGAHWSDEYKARMQAEMDALVRL
jgi:hypothetical protein